MKQFWLLFIFLSYFFLPPFTHAQVQVGTFDFPTITPTPADIHFNQQNQQTTEKDKSNTTQKKPLTQKQKQQAISDARGYGVSIVEWLKKGLYSPFTTVYVDKDGNPCQSFVDLSKCQAKYKSLPIYNYYNPTSGVLLKNNGYIATVRLAKDWSVYGINGAYWCTYLIIDAYNLAGIKGLSVNSFDARVQGLLNHFINSYLFLNYSTSQASTLKSIQSGYAMFLIGTTSENEHVAMVDSITLDKHGNGRIDLIQANGFTQRIAYPINNYSIKNTEYPVSGFGGL